MPDNTNRRTQARTMVCRSAEFHTRAEDGNLYIEGYFATFTGRYEMWEGAYEQVDRRAFDGTLDDDVRALVNHDTTLVLGRTRAGTLELRTDERGLWGRITVNQKDQDAMNLYERVQRGDVNQCSFGFDILEQEFTEDRQAGTMTWTLKRVRLYEVSVCTFPAYEDTSVVARRRDYDELRRRELDAWRARMLETIHQKEETQHVESTDAPAQH